MASTERNETLFLCLARDCERSLPRFFAYLQQLWAAGIPCSAIVGENGSRDRTRELIVAASGDGVELVDTSAMSAAPQRLARMAIGRQMLLEAARERVERPAFICVADLDNVMEEPPAVSAVLAAMQRLRADDGLFGVSATSRPFYYDLLALKSAEYDFATLDAEIAQAKRKPLTYHRFHVRKIYGPQRMVTSALPTVCQSTFNGFCVYKAEDYLRGSYRAANEAEVCEHVSMNLSVGRATGRHMQIFGELVVREPHDHEPVGFTRFWFDRLREAALRIASQ